MLQFKSRCAKYCRSLSENIAFFEYGINQEVALGISQFCGVSFAAQIYKSRGRDYGDELMTASMS